MHLNPERVHETTKAELADKLIDLLLTPASTSSRARSSTSSAIAEWSTKSASAQSKEWPETVAAVGPFLARTV
jgi:hypothetical protein